MVTANRPCIPTSVAVHRMLVVVQVRLIVNKWFLSQQRASQHCSQPLMQGCMVYQLLPFCVTPLFEYIVDQQQISSLLNRHPYILLISLEIFFITCYNTNAYKCITPNTTNKSHNPQPGLQSLELSKTTCDQLLAVFVSKGFVICDCDLL